MGHVFVYDLRGNDHRMKRAAAVLGCFDFDIHFMACEQELSTAYHCLCFAFVCTLARSLSEEALRRAGQGVGVGAAGTEAEHTDAEVDDSGDEGTDTEDNDGGEEDIDAEFHEGDEKDTNAEETKATTGTRGQW
jgi:hypothetical protein